MRRMAMAVVGLVLGVAGISAQTTPEAKTAAAQYKDGLLKARAESLSGTTVTPHLEEAITPGKNVVWCSSFQLVWNEACKLIGEDLHFVDEPPMVGVMNKKGATKEDIDEASCLIIADWLNPGLTGRIEKAIKEKFGKKADPQLFNEVKGEVNEAVRAKVNGLFAYAYLLKELSFAVPFEKLDEPLIFDGKPVKAFGISHFSGSDERTKQVNVLYSGEAKGEGAGAGEIELVVELKTNSPGDRLILAMVRPAKTLGETIARVRELAAEPTGGKGEFGFADRLVVPKMNFDVTREYSELMGSAIKVANPKLQGDPLFAFVMGQRIKFKLDEKGVVLHSEAGGGIWGAEPPRLVFDRPFLIMIERKGAKTPYLAMWVGNAELLAPSEKDVELVSKLPFDDVDDFSEGLAGVKVRETGSGSATTRYEQERWGRWGFIDEAGNWAAKPEFGDVGRFHEGLAAAAVIEQGAIIDETVITDGVVTGMREKDRLKWGFIDKKGNWVVKPQYDFAHDFHEGLAGVGVRVDKGGFKRIREEDGTEDGIIVGKETAPRMRFGFIDKTGKTAIAQAYDDVGDFRGGVALVNRGGSRDESPTLGEDMHDMRVWAPEKNHRGILASGGTWGYINEKGELLSGKMYDEAGDFDEGPAAIRVGKEWGFMDKAGRVVVEPQYERFEPFKEGRAAVDINPRRNETESWAPGSEHSVTGLGEWGFIDKLGRVTSKPQYDRVSSFSEGLAAVELDGEWGFIGPDGKFAVEARFEDADDFHEGKAAVKAGGKWGFIDKTGKFVAEAQFEIVDAFEGGRAIVFKDGKVGCLDGEGKTVAMMEGAGGNNAKDSAGVCIFEKQQRRGYIDKTGKMAISGEFKEFWEFFDGLAGVRVWDEEETAEVMEFIDKTGKVAAGPFIKGFKEYERPIFSEGLVVFETDAGCGYMDRTGKTAIPARFTKACPFYEGFAAAEAEGKWGYIDHKGDWLIEPALDEADEFSEGLARVRVAGQYGFVNRKGEFAIAPAYEWAESFSQGLAAVKVAGKWGYIDGTGRLAIGASLAGATPFSEGLAAVWTEDGREGFIDRRGRFANRQRYEEARAFSEGLAAVKVDGKWGYIDKTFRMRIKPAFDEAGAFSEGRAVVTTVARTRYIDTKGRFIGASHYESASSFGEGLAAVTLAGGLWLVNAEGKVKELPDFRYFEPNFSEGVCAVWTPDGEGYIDGNGDWAIAPRAELRWCRAFRDGLAMAGSQERVGLINHKGEWVVRPGLSRIGDFINGIARVKAGESSYGTCCGFVKKDGTLLQPAP